MKDISVLADFKAEVFLPLILPDLFLRVRVR